MKNSKFKFYFGFCSSNDEVYGFHITLLVNLILLNGFYIGFAVQPYAQYSQALCGSFGVLLHYFFITTFGILFSLLLWKSFSKIFENPKVFTIVSCVVVYGEYILFWSAMNSPIT